ncbi:acyl-CoA dehydrogenase family protein [Parafrankia sp. EUN1f]|uniref:acyl-CoA dehydrogenase family protein n=1 Tax=Parafrankia sp. EUN1f TaxID=102897 RepID=UPI0001C47171|nr:acyl-CoA dehydrogenase family protein [Parafrankia sp. EUN1f]EFC79597.1 acyl-CoA dehydrogenase domain protein [Parafrankia sp. EUN1f]
MNEDLLVLATTTAEREFATQAVAFLSARYDRRRSLTANWGEGDEALSLFHESTDAQERAEANAARAWQRARWDAGFGWIAGPVEYGGRGLPASHDRLYRMIEGAFDVPDMSPLRIGLGTISPVLVAFGTPELIETYAVPMQRGDLIGCQLFSEPGAGSDLAGVRTRAIRRGDDWVIDGQKVWTSNGSFADIGLAIVRTDADAPKHRGLTLFVVPMDTPGVEVRRIRQLTGGHSFAETFLSDVAVPDSHRLGEEGEGWKITNRALAGERRSVGDRSHEMNARALELLRTLAERVGRSDDPLVRDRWAALYVSLQSARFQQQRMQAVPEDRLTGAERAIDKVVVAWAFRDLGRLAAELLGPSFAADTGEWGTFAWTRWSLGALGYRIAGGTEEIIKTVIAERVLGLPREPRV